MKYEFIPYTPTSKIDCPSCGHKKSFVRYLDTETGEILPNEFGKCDRENNCSYWRKPFREKVFTDFQAITPLQTAPQLFIDKEIVYTCLKWYDENEFVVSLIAKFGSELVEKAVKKYFLGTSKDYRTLYFYIDYESRVTSVKAIKYNGLNRDKSVPPIYPYKTSEGYYPCLFGMHIVDKDKDVHIVEAEKTAVIMSMVHDEPYLATGGSNMFSLTKAKVFRDIGFTGTCYLYPDCDKAGREAVLKWKENLDMYDIKNQIVEQDVENESGKDLADMLLDTWQK